MSEAPALSIDPFDQAFLADPYAHHPVLRDAGPVVWLESIGAYAMARFVEVREALNDHGAFVSWGGVGLADFATEEPWRPPSLLLEADPPLHDRTRSLMGRVVSLKTVKALRPRWREQAEQLVDRLVANGGFDAVTDLAEAFPMSVFPDTIGVPTEGRETLLAYAASVFNAFGPRNALCERTAAEAAGAFAWVANACRRENLSADGWGAAVYGAADRGECTELEAERLVRSFLSAGVDTTINGIAHLILGFACFPDQWTRLRERPALATKAFDESLRWDSTVQIFFRTTSRPVTVAGVDIRSDAKVLLFLGSANRDPRRWADPTRFDIDRVTSGHVGFGFGVHQCLGQMLARLEGELVIDALRRRVRSLRLAGESERRLNNTLHAIAHLPIEAKAA